MTTRPAPAARPWQRSPGRLLYADNLRVALTVLVVLHHCAVTYGSIPLWYHTEPAQDPTGAALDLMVVLDQAFFMGLFFLLSGFFVPGSLERKGGRRFLRDRLVRLGVPLLLFLFLLRPAATAGMYLDQFADLPYWFFYIVSWDPGPMWFVETLLVFCLAYVLVRRLRRPSATAGPGCADALGRPGPGAFPGPAAVAAFTAVLAAATWTWRIAVPTGSFWPVVGLPTPSFLPQYALMFAVGAAAARRGWLDRVPNGAGWGGLAASASALLLLPAYLAAPMDPAPFSPDALVGPVFESVFAVGAALSLLWLFQRCLDHQGPFGRFLSANAYGVYFLHPVVLVGVGIALSGLQAPALAKFAALAAVALPVCWAAAHGLRSLPGARRVF